MEEDKSQDNSRSPLSAVQKLKSQNDKLKNELKTLNSQLEAALHKQRQAGIE